MQYEALQIEQYRAPDHFIAPEQLSSFERRYLKDTFDVVRTMQVALEARY